MLKKNLILMLLTLILAVLPLVMHANAAFEGADGQAEEAVLTINPEYIPWFQPLMTPPSGEIESLLFSLQAAIGAGVMGFILGRMTAPKHREKTHVQHG